MVNWTAALYGIVANFPVLIVVSSLPGAVGGALGGMMGSDRATAGRAPA